MHIAACHLTLTAHKDCRWPHLQVRSVDNFYRDGQKKCQFKWSIWSQKCSQNVTWWSLHLKTENKCCFQPNRSILSSRKQDWRCKSRVEYSPLMCKARGSVPRAIKISNIINRQTNSTERMYRTGEWTTRLNSQLLREDPPLQSLHAATKLRCFLLCPLSLPKEKRLFCWTKRTALSLKSNCFPEITNETL